jgi:hypothetical protein
MEDAHEEFASLAPILDRFAEWKAKHTESYGQVFILSYLLLFLLLVFCVFIFPHPQAYGTLSLQKVCETFIRQEMLVRWELLGFPPLAFEEYEWFEEIQAFLKKSEHHV